MKKTISAILCICMILSLCACGAGGAAEEQNAAPQPTADAAPVTEVLPAPDAEESAAAFGADLGDRVVIRTVKTQDSFNAPDGSVILLFSYVTPTVLIEERPQAAAAINEQLVLLDEAFISGSGDEPGKNQILEDALDNYSYVMEKGAELNTVFTAARTVTSTRADGSVISFRYWTSIYTGRSNGRHGYYGLSFNSETGEKLTLDDLSAEPEAFHSRLSACVVEAARQDKTFYTRFAETHEDPDGALAAIVRDGNWYFSSEGVVFFPHYGELEPEDEALPMFTVPYEALSGLMYERYLPVERTGTADFDVLRVEDVRDGTVQSIDRLFVTDGDELYLKINGTAYDVTVSSFFYVHQAEGDERFHAKDRLWYASYMNDCALQICTLVPNGMPDLMVTYTDADYAEHRLFISQSGEGDGVALVDDTIQAVG